MAYVAKYLRATTSTGDVYEDPSEDVLFELIGDIENGTEEFVIVSRVADVSNQTFSQVIFCDVGTTTGQCNCVVEHDGKLWTIERREGGPELHWVTHSESYREIHRLLTEWAMSGGSPDADFAGHVWSSLRF